MSEALTGPRQTNQRAELTAILRALEAVPHHREVLIHSDSNYAIKCVTEWHVNWLKKDWKTSSGKDVENRDLVEATIEEIKLRTKHGAATKFKWVKGHATNIGNNEADKLAVAGARKGLQ
jgi:ribonuclease HI